MGKIVNIVECARRLGVTEQTLRNWIKDGHIKVKKVGNARYIDEDTINALQDTVEDIEQQKKKMESLLAELRCGTERLEIQCEEDKTRRRLLKVIYSSAFRNDFFLIVTSLLHSYGDLNEREANILAESLQGYTLEEIGFRYGLTRERVRQIAEKAIRKSRDLEKLEWYLDRARQTEKENEMLKATISGLKEKLYNYEKSGKASDVEKDSIVALYELFSKDIRDCGLSVRAMNCLRGGDRWRNIESCNTLGDVCKMSREKIMKIRNAGKKTLREVEDLLCSMNLSFGMDVDKVYAEYSQIKEMV